MRIRVLNAKAPFLPRQAEIDNLCPSYHGYCPNGSCPDLNIICPPGGGGSCDFDIPDPCPHCLTAGMNVVTPK